MRRLLVCFALFCFAAVTSVASQQLPPLRVGAHVAGNMMNGPFDLIRVGGKVMLPVSARLYAQGSVNRFTGGAEWEVSGALRYRPFGATAGDSPFYLGVGWAGINFGGNHESYDLWLTGLELPVGRFRPYVELQFLGPVQRLVADGDWGVQAYSGITWSVR
ncbi:MAG: hypothetical protein ACRDH5_11220 [bacterium]